MRVRWLILTCAVLSACSSLTAPTVPFNQDFTLAPGEAVSVADTAARIRFLEVRGDSRCPADVACVQGGDAIVRIEVLSKGAHSERYDFHTGSPTPLAHGGFTIALVALRPYPFSSGQIQPGDYRLTLRVSG